MSNELTIRIGVRLSIAATLLFSSAALAVGHPDNAVGIPDDANQFLGFLNKTSPLFKEDNTTATAYYNAIDPDQTHRTLAAFRTVTGLATGADADAAYINNADLGFGRRMTTRVNDDGSVTSCVENYGDNLGKVGDGVQAEKLLNAETRNLKTLIATVCMDYSGTPASYAPVTGTTTTTTTLVAYNDNISSTNKNSRISMLLQPGNYRMVAATYSSGKSGSFTLKTTGVVYNYSGSWTSSGGRSYTSTANPKYPLVVTTATTVVINLASSTVDTYLYLLKDTTTTTAPANRELFGRKFTKFYVYGHTQPDHVLVAARLPTSDNFALAADLDDRGAKAIPGLCNVCHGGAPKSLVNGAYPDLGDTNTQWLPWDLDTLVHESNAASPFSLANQQDDFKKFNQAVLATYPNPESPSNLAARGIQTNLKWSWPAKAVSTQTGGKLPIPDYSATGVPAKAQLIVSGVKGTIADLVISIDGTAGGVAGIQHGRVSDLALTLVSPVGKRINLGLGNGDTNRFSASSVDIRNAYWSDDAFNPFPMRNNQSVTVGGFVVGVAPYSGVYTTSVTLVRKDLQGDSPNGTWTLEVRDDIAGTTGVINSWSLYFNSVPDQVYVPANVELIRGWYGGASAANPTPNPNFNGAFVPVGWNIPAVTTNGKVLLPADLYKKVIGPTCRACHAQRGTLMRNEIDFSTYDKFIYYAAPIESLVYDKGVMPLAKRTYQTIFWASNQAEILGDFIPNFNHRVTGSATTVLKPGRPIANAGVSRLVAGRVDDFGVYYFSDLSVRLNAPFTLNGNGSLFANQFTDANPKPTNFKWTLVAQPAGSTALLATESVKANPLYSPTAYGDYRFKLEVSYVDRNNVTVVSAPSYVTMQASTTARLPLDFASQIYGLTGALGTSCSTCHGDTYKKGLPTFPYVATTALIDEAYLHTTERIDLTDPRNSLIILKASRDQSLPSIGAGSQVKRPHVGGAAIDLYKSADLLQWILEGGKRTP